MEKKPIIKKGFAAFSEEKKAEIHAKSLKTRSDKAKKKREVAGQAKTLRDKAIKLKKQAEALDFEADQVDGGRTSEKSRKQYEAKLSEEITEVFGNSVSPQYLRQMIQHAILRNYSVDQIITPTMAAMDILNDPASSITERRDAMKALQSFESAKPAIVETEESTIGSVQEEMQKLMEKHREVAPKREVTYANSES